MSILTVWLCTIILAASIGAPAGVACMHSAEESVFILDLLEWTAIFIISHSWGYSDTFQMIVWVTNNGNVKCWCIHCSSRMGHSNHFQKKICSDDEASLVHVFPFLPFWYKWNIYLIAKSTPNATATERSKARSGARFAFVISNSSTWVGKSEGILASSVWTLIIL